MLSIVAQDILVTFYNYEQFARQRYAFYDAHCLFMFCHSGYNWSNLPLARKTIVRDEFIWDDQYPQFTFVRPEEYGIVYAILTLSGNHDLNTEYGSVLQFYTKNVAFGDLSSSPTPPSPWFELRRL